MDADVLNSIWWVAYNLVLALIAVGLGFLLEWLGNREGMVRLTKAGLVVVVLVAWLAVVPNTCYLLLVGWRHFVTNVSVSGLYVKWMYAHDMSALMQLIRLSVFYMAVSVVGAITYVLALRPFFRLTEKRAPYWIVRPVFFLLLSVAVYLGLRQSFDYWDMSSFQNFDPQAVVAAFSRPVLPGLVIGFAIILWLIYLAMDIWMDGFQLRRQRQAIPGAPK